MYHVDIATQVSGVVCKQISCCVNGIIIHIITICVYMYMCIYVYVSVYVLCVGT